MSRCFPFPPPGYERNHRPEGLNLLKEAKHKEKRHKKDKERKKEKDKVGGDEKHGDKKDRKEKHKEKKEKHRDKRKDKEERGKDKEKSSISEELTVAGKLGNEGGEKLDPKGLRNDRNSFLNEEKSSNFFHGQSGVKPSQNSQPSQVIDNSKFVQELDRRIKDDENGRGSQLPQKLPVVGKRDQDMAARAAVWSSSGLLPEEKGSDKNKTIDRKIDPRGSDDVHNKNKSFQNVSPRCKVDGISKPLDEQNGRRLGEKEKFKEASDVKWRDKQKIRDIESRGMEKDKEKKKDESTKVKTENKRSEQRILKDNGGRNDLSGLVSNTSTDLLQSTDSKSLSEGRIRKREDFGTNGFLYESDVRPHKIQRSTPHHFTENGRKVEAFQTPGKPAHDVHPIVNSLRSDRKDQSKNGIIEVQKSLLPSKPNPVSGTTVSDRIVEAPNLPHRDSNSKSKELKVPSVEDLIAEASRRPPHPDSRYLPDVLTVPQPADWSENENDDWLYRKKGPSSKPDAMDSAGTHKDFHVWSEAVHIESADVCALPYVIPF